MKIYKHTMVDWEPQKIQEYEATELSDLYILTGGVYPHSIPIKNLERVYYPEIVHGNACMFSASTDPLPFYEGIKSACNTQVRHSFNKYAWWSARRDDIFDKLKDLQKERGIEVENSKDSNNEQDSPKT